MARSTLTKCTSSPPNRPGPKLGSTLLTFPLEIRLLIYTFLSNDQGKSQARNLYSISSACRQLRAEAFPYALKPAKDFTSTDAFIRWAQRGRLEWLACVSDIYISTERNIRATGRNGSGDSIFPARGNVKSSLNKERKRECDDIELDEGCPMMDSRWWEYRYARKLAAVEAGGNEMILPSLQQQLDYDLLSQKVTQYAKELTPQWKLRVKRNESLISTFWKVLIRLRSVTSLELYLSPYRWYDIQKINTPDAEQEIFIQMISLAMPAITSLTLSSSSLLSLSVLQHFRSLTHLEFWGYSRSSPTETLAILHSLPKLNSLSIVRMPTIYGNLREKTDTEIFHRQRCITEEVMSGLNPLRSLRIDHMILAYESPFLSKGMLRAALSSHGPSLRKLGLSSDEPISKGAFQVVLDLLPSCVVLEKIELVLMVQGDAEPEPIDVSEYLPPSVYEQDIRSYR